MYVYIKIIYIKMNEQTAEPILIENFNSQTTLVKGQTMGEQACVKLDGSFGLVD